jgi:hypothetical protein
MWPRRRPRLEEIELSPPPDESVRVLRPEDEAGFSAAMAVARIEKFVGAANATMLQLEDRLSQLEAATEDLANKLQNRPTHGDLLEVRLRGARTEAELNRLATELRAEIDEIKETTAPRASKQAEAS